MASKSDPALSAPVVLLHGNDEFRVDERARSLLKEKSSVPGADGSFTTVRGDVENVDDALEAMKQLFTSVQSANLFSPVNITWFREVMFFSGTVFQNEEVKERLEGFQELLEKGLNEGQMLVITVSGKLNANSRLAKMIKKVGHVEEFQKTTKEWEVADEAKQMVLEAAAARNLTFRPEALDELTERVGNDTRLIRNEVEKLSLCREDGPITREDIEQMVPLQQEAQAWKLSDCIGEKDLAGAMRLLQRMENQGANAVAAMAMLHNSLREMAYLGSCLHQNAAQLVEKGRFGSYTFTDPDAEMGFARLTGDKKRSPHRLYVLGRQGRRFTVRDLDRMLRLSADTYDGFFRRPLPHYEQLRLLLIRMFFECGSKAA